MAMTRLFSQSLTRKALVQPHPTITRIQQRNRSNKPQVIEVDEIRKLDEVLQSIIARRAAPDWLPFLPGYSYYVPPPSPSHNLVDVFKKLSHVPKLPGAELSIDNTASFRTDLVWPSSTYFIEGTAPTHPLPVGSIVDVNMYDFDEAAQEASCEDE